MDILSEILVLLTIQGRTRVPQPVKQESNNEQGRSSIVDFSDTVLSILSGIE
jgi:hypothetical protein